MFWRSKHSKGDNRGACPREDCPLNRGRSNEVVCTVRIIGEKGLGASSLWEKEVVFEKIGNSYFNKESVEFHPFKGYHFSHVLISGIPENFYICNKLTNEIRVEEHFETYKFPVKSLEILFD